MGVGGGTRRTEPGTCHRSACRRWWQVPGSGESPTSLRSPPSYPGNGRASTQAPRQECSRVWTSIRGFGRIWLDEETWQPDGASRLRALFSHLWAPLRIELEARILALLGSGFLRCPCPPPEGRPPPPAARRTVGALRTLLTASKGFQKRMALQ